MSDIQDAQRPRVAERFSSLSADLATARSQAPIPSASGAFRFSWDPGLDTFVRFQQDLGVPFAERAQTLGKGSFSFGLSYSRVEFDTVEGNRIGSLSSQQPALSSEFLEGLPIPDGDRMIFADDVLETQLSLDFAFDLFFVSAAYGLTDTIDIGLALSINRVRMRAQALAAILDSDGAGDAFFATNQPGAITDGGRSDMRFPVQVCL